MRQRQTDVHGRQQVEGLVIVRSRVGVFTRYREGTASDGRSRAIFNIFQDYSIFLLTSVDSRVGLCQQKNK